MINILQIIVLFIVSLVLPVSTYAQRSLGISAIPPRLEVTLKPGESITEVIKVRNESKDEKIISTKIKDFIVVDNSGTPIQIDTKNTSNRWTASNWIQVSSNELKLKPGETRSLSVTIIAPDDALPGGHYAMILHSPNNETVLSETGAVIQTNVGTLIYITIPGDINESANIKKFSAPNYSEYGPITFKATITNLSDVHITPIANIIITNYLGMTTDNLVLDSNNIFPYTSREYITSLNKHLLFGRFKAKLLVTYGKTNKIISHSLFFWVIPYKLIISLIAIIIIIILMIKLKNISKNENYQSTPKIEQLEQELEILKQKYKDRN